MTPTPVAWDTDSMPRRPPYGQGPDDWASWRVRFLRERKGWSQGQLARHVTDAGVPMQQQAIWKIENGNPPRRISLSEAIALGQVFDIAPTELAEPLEKVTSGLVEDIRQSVHDLAQSPLIGLLRDVRQLPPEPDIWPELLKALREQVEAIAAATVETEDWARTAEDSK